MAKKILSWSEERAKRERFHRRFNTVVLKVIPAIIISLIITGAVSYPVAYANSEREATITVTKLERIADSNGDKYIVFGDDETFEITDSFIFSRWDSSDLYGSLEEGKTYKVETAGWRFPLLSWYRNVLSVEELTDGQ